MTNSTQEPKTNILGVPQEEWEAMCMRAGEESAKEMQKISQTMPEEWTVELADVILKAQKEHKAVVPNVIIAVRKLLALANSQEREAIKSKVDLLEDLVLRGHFGTKNRAQLLTILSAITQPPLESLQKEGT